jgi:hypothetical protein
MVLQVEVADDERVLPVGAADEDDVRPRDERGASDADEG